MVERVDSAIRAGLDEEVNTVPEDAALLRQLQAAIERDDRAREVRAKAGKRSKERAQRIEEEARVMGERIGVPIGRLLAERGVTTETPILKVVPQRLSPARGIGFFGESRGSGTNLWDLGLGPVDSRTASAAFNVLAREVLYPFDMALEEDSIMGEVAQFDIRETGTPRGIGSQRLAILQAVVAQLPKPPQTASAVA